MSAAKLAFTEYEYADGFASTRNGDTGSLALMYKPPVAPWADSAVTEIAAFQSDYAEDNWDDEGAKAIALEAVKGSLGLIRALIKQVTLPRPNILAGFRGEIIFLWARKGHELKITISEVGNFEITAMMLGADAADVYPELDLQECIAILDPTLLYNIT